MPARSVSQNRMAWLTALAAAALAVAVHLGTLSVPFIYDDFFYVETNESIRKPGNAARLWLSSYPPEHVEQGLYRPLTATTYLVDHAVFGLDGKRFHITNTLLHATATFLFTLVLFRLSHNLPATWIGGLLFAVHAVHTEAVAWIVGRAEVLAAVFCFATVLLWTEYRRHGRHRLLGLIGLCYFLGSAAKETAVPLAAVLLLGDLLGVFGRTDAAPPTHLTDKAVAAPAAREQKGRRGREEHREPHPIAWSALAAPYLVLGLAFLAYVSLRLVALEGHFGVAENHRIFFSETTTTRFATALAGIGSYVRLMIWPLGLRIDYGDLMVHDFLEAQVALGLATAIALAAAAYACRRRAPLVTFWIGWFVLILLPFSNLIIEIGTVLAERILYVPSAGACALAGLVFASGLSPARSMWTRILSGAAVGVALVGLSTATVNRIREWQDPERFWRTALDRSPTSEKIHINLAGILWDKGLENDDHGLLEESDEVLRAGIALRPQSAVNYSRAHFQMLLNLGNHLRLRDRLDEGMPYYERLMELLRLFPDFDYQNRAEAFVEYGVALRDQRKLDDAIAAYREAASLRPQWSLPHEHLAYVLSEKRDYAGAIESYRTVISLDPAQGESQLNLGVLLHYVGRSDEALDPLVEAARIRAPGAESELRKVVRAVHDRQIAADDHAAAYATLSHLIEAGLTTADDAYALGKLAERLDAIEQAVAHYQTALSLNPNHEPSRAALAELGW